MMTTSPSDPATRHRRKSAPAVWRLGEGAPPAGPFVALVPGGDAPLLAVTLPASLKGPAREDVARRQVLDRLGLPAAALDIRAARLGGAEGWTRALVVERSAVLRWRAVLGAAAARCRALLPDYLALPAGAGVWTVAADAEGLRVRMGPGDGFSAEAELGVTMLAAAVAQARSANALPRVVLVTGDMAGLVGALEGLTVLRDGAPLPEGLTVAAFAHGELTLDLARDPRADAAVFERRLRRVALPLALVVLGALGWGGAVALGARHDLQAAAAIEAQTLAAARRDILPAGPIVDLRVQIAREIERRRAVLDPAPVARGPLDRLRGAALVLAGLDAQVQGATISAADQGVTVEVRVDDFRALDAMMAALDAAGIAARITRSGTEPEGGVSAAILIGGGAP